VYGDVFIDHPVEICLDLAYGLIREIGGLELEAFHVRVDLKLRAGPLEEAREQVFCAVPPHVVVGDEDSDQDRHDYNDSADSNPAIQCITTPMYRA